MKVNINKRNYQVHYLVATTFVTKPDKFDDTFTVDHIDNDCTNNSADNLRWVDKFVQVDNRRDSCRIHIHSLPVIAKNIVSGDILEFDSLHEAIEKIKEANFRHISSCVNNKRKTHAGYLWYPPDTLPDEEGEIWKHITTTPRYKLHIKRCVLVNACVVHCRDVPVGCSHNAGAKKGSICSNARGENRDKEERIQVIFKGRERYQEIL